MNVTLDQILALVGKLDDAPGDETASKRFQRFLLKNVKDVGQVRDYIEACLRTTGDQYHRAFQDLVNFTGHFLGFDETYGRYTGVQGEIGFDGHWKSPEGFHLVVEVKTTEVYAIKTATLLGYRNSLIDEQKIPDLRSSMGLYVVGRPDSEVNQLEHAIVAQSLTDQLRVISVDSLLSLAEMMQAYDLTQSDILSVLRPSGPQIDPLVKLMATLMAAGTVPGVESRPTTPQLDIRAADIAGSGVLETEPRPTTSQLGGYWLLPVAADDEESAEEIIQRLVEQGKVWAGRRVKALKPGDHVCFYASGNGVVARATVRTPPELTLHPIAAPVEPSWVFDLKDVVVDLENPVVIDEQLRAKLNAFQKIDPNKAWSWIVMGTRHVDQHDFEVLTGKCRGT